MGFSPSTYSPPTIAQHMHLYAKIYNPEKEGETKKKKVSSPNDKDVVFGATGAISSGLGGFSIPPRVRPQVVEAGSHYLRSQS